MAAVAKRTGRDAATAGRSRTTGKTTRAAAKAPTKGYKTAVRKSPVKAATPKSAPGRTQTRRKASTGGAAGRLDSVLAARLEAIAHGLEQIGGLRADLEELRTQIGTIAQSVTTLAEAVEAILSTDRHGNSLDRPATMAPDRASTDETPGEQPASADKEAEAEPSD